MIKFKQKEYFWGGLISGGLSAMGLVQGGKQMKEASEQAHQQEILLKRQNRALEKIAENAKNNPIAAQQAADVVSGQATFSAAGIAKGALKFAKSLGQASGNVIKKEALGNMKTGLIMAGGTYVGGKIIQANMKKNNLTIDENGALIPKSYSAIPPVNLKGAGTVAKKAMKGVGKFVKQNKVGLMFGAGFSTVPLVMGYASEKNQVQDQIRATQRQYAVNVGSVVSAIKGLGTTAKNGLKTFKSHPGQTLTGGALNLSSFQMLNTNKVQRIGRRLVTAGNKNGSHAAVKAGQWIQKHKTAANALALAPGALAVKATWEGTNKVAGKVGEMIDPGAYKYGKSKEKQVEK